MPGPGPRTSMENMSKVISLPGVPRWAARAAHAVPWIVLPSSLWRVALVLGLPVSDYRPGFGESLYVLSLSAVSEGLALLTLGLVRPWGEVVPRWIPLLGGRRVRPLAAVVPAALGAVALALIWGYAFRSVGAGLDSGIGPGGMGSPAQDAFLVLCYAPLLLWAPLLLAVTAAYYQRRTARPSAGEQPPGLPQGGQERLRAGHG
ncbi:hypothetical protein [Streptomyces sp. NRRL B-1347]|uniref:hypothetical protein n=1 Tax=Streptomyces sp. NRRL B-1347 TaxID=1476877 RepID=UPI001F2CB051|nr:hypothetical protein [Streptomyces sp. NRRL B-1347]